VIVEEERCMLALREKEERDPDMVSRSSCGSHGQTGRPCWNISQRCKDSTQLNNTDFEELCV